MGRSVRFSAMYATVLTWVVATRLNRLNASKFACSWNRSESGNTLVSRASVRATVPIGRLLGAQNGTRAEPPKPFSVVLKAAPGKGAPLTRTTGVAGCVEAKVEIWESRQPCARFGSDVELS